MNKPDLIIAADRSTSPEWRRMVAAQRGPSDDYVASAPEPVGDVTTLVHRCAMKVGPDGTALLLFDFPE